MFRNINLGDLLEDLYTTSSVSLVTAAWLVLSLRKEGRPPDMQLIKMLSLSLTN
jgi:hypothetical protein